MFQHHIWNWCQRMDGPALQNMRWAKTIFRIGVKGLGKNFIFGIINLGAIMAIVFSVGDILIPNAAYVNKSLSKATSTPTLKQALGILGGLKCVPATVADVGNLTLPVRSFLCLVPVDTSHRFYNQGTGVVVYLDTDAQLNNSFEVSGAYLKDKCFIQSLNNSGVSITKGQLVRQTGFDVSTQLVTVTLADATIAVNSVVLGVAMENIIDGQMGSILTDGSYQTDTSAFSISDQVFVSDTPGSISTTAGTVSVVCGRVLIVGVEGTISLFSTLTGGGTAPIVKPTVTGSRGGNAALASLLTALASLDFIIDSTTA